MLKIAYCDDLEEDRNRIMASLNNIEEKWREEFDICSFPDGVSLCENLKKNSYDIILLDIVMDVIDGIETARKIRSMGEDSQIIFVSNYDEKLRELFQFGTVAFIDKPLKTEDLEIALIRAYDKIKQDNEKIFVYKKNGHTYFLPIKDIVYFESYRNTVKIFTLKFEDSYYDTLTNTWEKLKKTEEFIMPNKSFIFNLKYVNIKSSYVIVKINTKTYNIGREYKIDTENRYINYIDKRCI